MKIIIEVEDGVFFNDYPLTEFENAMNYCNIPYTLYCDDDFIQAKYGQKQENKNDN